MKKCSRCKTNRSIENFSKRSGRKSGLQSKCKICEKELAENYRKTKKGISAKIYGSQIQSSKKRGHNPPLYTSKDFRDWLFSQTLFHHIFHLWEISNYDNMLIPSVDRIKDEDGYTFGNIQIMTWQENLDKAHRDNICGRKRKEVIQYSKDGVFVESYESIKEASRKTGLSQGNISLVCIGERNHTGGFVWKFKS
jgi:hypothetical protein